MKNLPSSQTNLRLLHNKHETKTIIFLEKEEKRIFKVVSSQRKETFEEVHREAEIATYLCRENPKHVVKVLDSFLLPSYDALKTWIFQATQGNEDILSIVKETMKPKHQDQFFILVEEYLPYPTLYQFIETHIDTLCVEDLQAILLKIFHFLQKNAPYFTHYDLHIHNIFICESNEDLDFVLIDFGLSFLNTIAYIPSSLHTLTKEYCHTTSNGYLNIYKNKMRPFYDALCKENLLKPSADIWSNQSNWFNQEECEKSIHIEKFLTKVEELFEPQIIGSNYGFIHVLPVHYWCSDVYRILSSIQNVIETLNAPDSKRFIELRNFLHHCFAFFPVSNGEACELFQDTCHQGHILKHKPKFYALQFSDFMEHFLMYNISAS